LRIYETHDTSLVDQIVLTTNNQNRITNRNLRANDQVQIDLENAFNIHGYFYERKPKQFLDQSVDSERVLPNELVGQSFLSVVLKKPSDGRGRKYKVWSDFYDSIFMGYGVEPYIVSTLLVRLCTRWLGSQGLTADTDDTKRNLAKKGAYQVSRIASYFWRGDDSWKIDQEILRKQLSTLENEPDSINSHFGNAFGRLESIIAAEPHYVNDLDNALKSYTLDEQINRSLYTQS